MKNRFALLFLLAGLLLVAAACTTEDIDPVASVRFDSLQNGRIQENSGIAIVIASLNGMSKKDVRLRFAFSGTAVQGTDYTVSAAEVVILSGKTTGSFTITALDDSLEEGDKSIIINLLSSENLTTTEGASQTILLTDDDIDTDLDGLVDALDGCPSDSGAVSNNGCPAGFGLLINEVLYDPGPGADGNANGDTVTDKYQDGFIEFYNITNSPQDLAGFSISDSVISTGVVTERYVIPAGTVLPAKKALVIFGGGKPTGSFGGAVVLTVGTPFGLSMQNQGEKILVKDPLGKIILTFDSDALSNNPDESYTRNPDITGDFVQHGSVVTGKLFSPGTKTDGSSF